MNTFFAQLRRTYEDLSRHWTPFGSFMVVTFAIASVLANLLQIISFFPIQQTITIPVAPLVIFGILIISAIASFAFQLRSSNVIFKRVGATQLTDIWLIRNKGELYYGAIRNLLVRLGTIQKILGGVRDAVEEIEGLEQGTETRNYLYDIGKDIGRDFADKFVDQYGVSTESMENTIDEWCEYDIEAGWGRFIFLPSSSEFMGKIQVRSNILTSPENTNNIDQSLCGFLEGYISGILEVFARVQYPLKNWYAEVTEQSCGLHQGGLHPCEFDFVIREVELALTSH